MTVRLRAHHLLCMLTYVGEGYSRAFTANYDRIVARLSAGEEIELVAGPDDVCAPLLEGAEPHCHQESVVERDRLAALAVSEIVGRRLVVGETIGLSAALVERMREAFASGISREACSACEWSGLCTRIADGGYAGVRLEC
ncbi:DUF1284 domain-containing protein [Devosia sp. D6-9]|nr:DUF1284 domain-containing protein [Devosia sp. D6-9]